MQAFGVSTMQAELDYRRERISHDLKRPSSAARRHHHLLRGHRRSRTEVAG